MKRLSRLLLLMLLMETWVIAAESPIAGTRRDQGKTTLVDAMLHQAVSSAKASRCWLG